jgi:predicted nucleic acid-binding protein
MRHPARWNHLRESALFVDSWAWLVLAESRNPAYPELLAIRRRDEASGQPWVTTDFILDETITRLFSKFPFQEAELFCRRIFQAQESGALRIESVTTDRFQKAFQLRLQYRDKPRISFTDLTSFVVMKELGLHRVLTADAHFVQVGMGFERLP